MGSRVPTRGKIRRKAKGSMLEKGETYAPLFHSVYRSGTYRGLTAKARVLLNDLAYQYRGNNNGALVLCPHERDLRDQLTVLERTGLSEPSIYRAAAELEARGLIVCTQRGSFARRASRYALTWEPVDVTGIEYGITISTETSLKWWRFGPPAWVHKRLNAASKLHREELKKFLDSQRDAEEPLIVLPKITIKSKRSSA